MVLFKIAFEGQQRGKSPVNKDLCDFFSPQSGDSEPCPRSQCLFARKGHL